MLQDHLEVDAVLFRRVHDGVPLARRRQIQIAEFCRFAAGGPVEVLAVPVRHPDPRPVFARVVHLGKEVRRAGQFIRVPRLIVTDGIVARAAIELEATVVAAIYPHEARFRVAVDRPLFLVQSLLMHGLAVEFHAHDRIGSRHGGRVADAPRAVAIVEGGNIYRAVVRFADGDLHVDVLVVERVALQIGQFE